MSKHRWLSNCFIFSYLIGEILYLLVSTTLPGVNRSSALLSGISVKSPQETGARLGSWHPGSWCGVPYHVCSYSMGHLLSTLPSGSGPDGLHNAVWIREGLETGQQWPCVWCGACCVSGLEKGGSDGEMFLPHTVFSASTSIYSLGIVGQSHLRNRFSFFACCR